jgi:leucyl-tRNA synthetase
VQVNGKLRGRIHVAFGTAERELIESAKIEEKVRQFLEGKHVVKAIAVPDKLVNFVVT